MESGKTQEAYRRNFKNLDEMEVALGTELGLTAWTQMDQDRINTFAKVTEDEQWIHIDADRCAKESPYQQPIAHGFLMLSLCSKIMFEVYEVGQVSMTINYGLDKVRFPNPTPVGTNFRGRVVLADFKRIPKGAKYKLNVTIELEGQEKPACVAEFLALAYH
jgi:acyl dehydratase